MSGAPTALSGLFSDGLVVDLILALVAVEAVVLAAYLQITKRGPPFSTLLANLLAGTFLLLALRAALNNSGEVLIAACLFGALVAHVLDLISRFRAAAHPSNPEKPPSV